MFTAIKNLAVLNEDVSEIDSFLDYPGSKSTKEAKFLLIEKQPDGKYEYKGLQTEELDKSLISKYLYPIKTNRPARGVYLTPTIVYQEYQKSYYQKIFEWFKKYQQLTPLFQGIYEALKNGEDSILKDLTPVGKNTYLSLKIESKYIGEYQEFISLIMSDKEIIKSISSKYGKESIIEEGFCSICLTERQGLYGFSIPFSFFTVDSPGFAYDFDQTNAVKQYPICLECAKKIRGSGRNFLENELSLRLCNTDYFIIPELLEGAETKQNKLQKVVDKIKEGRAKLNNLYTSEKNFKTINRAESYILKELASENDYIHFNLFFYKRDQSKFNILTSIEEVLPSSLRKLYEAIKAIDNLFKENNIYIHIKKEDVEIKFNFLILSNLLENQEIQYNKRSKKEFMEVLNKFLTLRPLSYSYLLHKINEKLKKNVGDYIQGSFYKYRELLFESFLFLNILLKLKLIELGENQTPMTKLDTPNLDLLCAEFPEFFDCPVRKAVFGLGLLTENLANIQRKDRGTKAIYKKLRNFNVDLKYLGEKILPELKNKFHAYKKDYKSINILFEEISQCFLASDYKSLTSGETSYIFVLGINLSVTFMNKYYEHNKEIAKNEEEKQTVLAGKGE
jgi:CRISPR-associated protein Csh1